MTAGTGTQIFKLNNSSTQAKVLRFVRDLTLCFITWFVLTLILAWILEKVTGSLTESPLTAAVVVIFLISGILVVPSITVFRWYAFEEHTIALDSEAGITLKQKSVRRGELIKRYDWQSISGTEMVGTTSGNGAHTRYCFHVYTSDGEQLRIPLRMESFSYFLDIINRTTTHLPYTWIPTGTTEGWRRLSRQ